MEVAGIVPEMFYFWRSLLYSQPELRGLVSLRAVVQLYGALGERFSITKGSTWPNDYGDRGFSFHSRGFELFVWIVCSDFRSSPLPGSCGKMLLLRQLVNCYYE